MILDGRNRGYRIAFDYNDGRWHIHEDVEDGFRRVITLGRVGKPGGYDNAMEAVTGLSYYLDQNPPLIKNTDGVVVVQV